MNTTKQNNIPEIICYFIFIVCTIFISFFHEPWNDEFQAWAISKDTFRNILFSVPHYEGHPPLWYLVLKCFSSLNIDPEKGLSIANFIFIYPAIWLLVFKSPFDRIIRLSLPFTYFFFYQYSVISRPYSIFIFAFFLAGLFYKERNTKPIKYVGALILLSLTSAYGMVFSAGIIIAWFIEILKSTKFTIESFIKDQRILSMALIFFVCLAITFIIYPAKDVLYMEQFSGYKSLKLLFSFFILPLDTLITNICYSTPKFNNVNILWCIPALFLYFLAYKIFKFYKSLLLFFIPFLMFLTVVYSLYIGVHHTGLLTIFYIFVFWCIFSTKHPLMPFNMKKRYSLILILIIFVQIYWSINSYIFEYKYDYFSARRVANYIKKYNLSDYLMYPGVRYIRTYINKETGEVLPYNIRISKETKNIFAQKYFLKEEINYNIQRLPVSVNPYFKKNVFYSYNINEPNIDYVRLKYISEEENEKLKEKIESFGIPDIIFCLPMDIKSLVGDKEIYFIKLQHFKNNKIWKNHLEPGSIIIYAREDIYNKLKEKYPDIDEEFI